MEYLFAFGGLAFGLMMILIGFKVYNPFKGKNEPEKEEEWYRKFGTFFKVVGVIIFLYDLWDVINLL